MAATVDALVQMLTPLPFPLPSSPSLSAPAMSPPGTSAGTQQQALQDAWAPYGGVPNWLNASFGEPSGSAVTDSGGVETFGSVPNINVPQGYGFFNPVLDAFVRLIGLGQQREQFATTSRLAAAQHLANLRAQGPQSAAELAFLQGGIGIPTSGQTAPLEALLGNATRGASGAPSVADLPGGQNVSVPQTLSGSQLTGLAGNPNLAGVMGSFAQAAGNPDIFQRSLAALIPANFRGVGSGF